MRYLKRGLNIAPVLVFILIFGVMASALSAQVYLTDQYRTVYAVTNAKIVTGNGNTIEGGIVLLKDGLISAVGTEVEIPPEAKVIDGTGLTVYPGFIDLHTNLGFKSVPAQRSRGSNGQKEEEGPITHKYDKNLRPDQVAFDSIDFGDDKFKAAREAGITSVLTIKPRGVFPGKSTVIATNGGSPAGSLVKHTAFPFIQYSNERPGYPQTLFAVVAFQRQKLIDAKYFMGLEKEYMKNPRGTINSIKKRFKYDPVLKYLFPVVSGEEQVVIPVLKENDIKRALDLVEFDNEFKLSYVLSGVTEGYRIVDLLKERNVAAIVSVDFPEAKNVTGYSFHLPIKPYEAPPVEGEKAPKKKKEKTEVEKMIDEQVQGNAATLYNAGVPFVLSAGGKFKDFHKNIGLAVKAGLPADVALAKITREPAAMLGMGDILGTVELGKVGNLVVTNGELFADTTKVKMVFIDGNMFEVKEPPKTSGTGVAGEWDITIDTPMGAQSGKMVLEVKGKDITGTISTEMEITITSGTFDNNQINFTVEVEGMVIEFVGKLEEGKLSGTAEITGMGTATWSAERPGR